MPDIKNEVRRRRTFAIISHPDAGKTTLTEKLLLYGGAIQLAGTVKGRKASRHATSDWMALEQQRGISVTSSVMQFPYKDHVVNLLDTPGHEDFSEDTYRTLTGWPNDENYRAHRRSSCTKQHIIQQHFAITMRSIIRVHTDIEYVSLNCRD